MSRADRVLPSKRPSLVGQRVMLRNGILYGLLATVKKESARTSNITVCLVEGRKAYAVGSEVNVPRHDVAIAPEVMNFWRDNRTANHFTLPVAEVVEKFAASHWAEVARTAWPLERALRAFLTDGEDGLRSVFEENEYPALHEFCRRRLFPEDAS